jgi:hypothetical protein
MFLKHNRDSFLKHQKNKENGVYVNAMRNILLNFYSLVKKSIRFLNELGLIFPVFIISLLDACIPEEELK